MSGIKDQDRLDEVRKRLYERGIARNLSKSHELGDIKKDVQTTWVEPPKPVVPVPPPPVQTPVLAANELSDMSPKKRKRGYRIKILLAGAGFFVLAIVLSSAFLMFGHTSISGENITISATGPFTIGGGEELPLQVGITNANSVSIESATLIVEYPNGTQSSTEKGKDLFTERLPLQTIKQGETVNVPMKAVVFGEENEEKTVKVSIEYRVQGSNATFFKEAAPLRFKISSSPIIVRADTLKKISSGQETEVTLTIISNSPTPLSQILVKAEYPTGFDFTKSDPAPTHAQNMWLIENLEPEKEQTITITGVVIGKETDENAVNFTVGVPNERDPQSLASVFATTQTQFQIEQPFLDISMEINNSSDKEIAIDPGKRSNVDIEFKNTLEDPLYDLGIEVKLSGNAFSIYEVGPSSGYFDQTKKTILWDVSNTSELKQVNPGEVKHLSFSVQPNEGVSRTPQINIDVNAKARRVSERQVAEQLVGTASSVVKVVSSPKILAVINHNNGVFADTGPIPPVVDKATTYTVSLVVENGSNDITDAIVSASLPAYVTWLNKTDGSGAISYNPTTRGLEWKAGDVSANAEAYASFQVSFTPRSLQVHTSPVLVSEQRVKAVDRFTGTVVRDSNGAITSRLSSESGDDEASGEVRATESN